jgi:hypothetical protein
MSIIRKIVSSSAMLVRLEPHVGCMYMQANQELLYIVLGFPIVEVIFVHQRMTYLFPIMNRLGDVDKHLFFVSASVHIELRILDLLIVLLTIFKTNKTRYLCTKK